jgi:hypothetical protein
MNFTDQGENHLPIQRCKFGRFPTILRFASPSRHLAISRVTNRDTPIPAVEMPTIKDSKLPSGLASDKISIGNPQAS